MRTLARWMIGGGAGAAALAVAASGLTPAAATSATAARGATHMARAASATAPGAASARAARAAVTSGPVSNVPASGTPALVHTGSSSALQWISQIVQCGNTMYAVGSFSEISQNGTNIARNNVFSFSATAPYTVTSWNPNVNGQVNSIALTSNCNHAYIGGSFTKVAGSGAGNIADIRTYNNTMVQSWPHSASNTVDTVLLAGSHLLVGGRFTSINGSSGHAYYASLNPGTGKDDGYLNLHVSGKYVYPGVQANYTQVANQQLSPAGGHVLVEGVFTSAGGKPRQQIFMLNLAASHGNVSDWNSAQFSQHCATKHPFYIQDAAWSPDASTVYIADTGFAPSGWTGSFPLTGLCDAAAAFPATRVGGLTPEWVNYTGCDSLFAVGADASAVYVAGHPRWSENAYACNSAGTGAIPDQGMQGLQPGSGQTLVKPDGTAVYSMSRANADGMLVTSAGLWIASTDRYGASWCNNVSGHAGICFLPR